MPPVFRGNGQASARPAGVVVLAIGCSIVAVYLLISGALVQASILSLASGRYLLGEYATMGPGLYFSVAIALATIGVGLLKTWNCSRRLAVIAAAMLFATAVLPLSAAVSYFHVAAILIHGAKMILAVVIIRYLLQAEVVDFFSAKGVPPAT